MTEPVPTRAHREMAFNARWPDEAYSNPTLKWLDNGLKSNGDNLIVFQECERIALALATVEHNARREAEHRVWHQAYKAALDDVGYAGQQFTPCPYPPPGGASDV